MKTIFIIDGTSGIWKSDLINYVSACKIRSDMFKKCSTRKKRPEEKETDLKFMNNKAFESCNFDFQYSYNQHKYGFNKKEIEDILTNVDNLFIVIRNLALIQEFAKTFSKYNIVKVFIYTDFHVVSARIPNANNLEQKKCIADTFQEYLRHPDVYDEIIINGGTANDFNRLIDSLVTSFTVPKNEEKSQIVKGENNLIAHLSKSMLAKVVLPVAIASITTILMHKFLLGKLQITNPIFLQVLLVLGSLIVYILPQILFYFFVKTKIQYEKNKTWFEFIHLIIAVLVYSMMFYFYAFKK